MYLLVSDSDALIAKAFVLPEVARIAAAELRLNEMLLGKWRIRRKQAEAKAAGMARQGRAGKDIAATVDKIMGRFPRDVDKAFRDSMKKIYRLSRRAGWKKGSRQTTASLQYSGAMLDALSRKVQKSAKPLDVDGVKVALSPTFDLADDAAIAALQDDQMLWIKEHYGTSARDAVRVRAIEVMKLGLGTQAAGIALAAAMRDVLGNFGLPRGFHGTEESYFEAVAANAATNARVRGKIRSFTDLGITTYVLVNPMDHKTSEICQHLNGKVFRIENGINQVDAEQGADTVAQVKKAHPFLTFDEIKRISPKAGNAGKADSDALSKSGVSLPPFHVKCRTVVDVSFESSSVGALRPRP
jgi:hypothetical protein